MVVDQFLAAKAFPNESALGKRILIRMRTPEPEWVEIVGVVGHQRATSLAEAGREQIYFMDGFVGHGVAARWAVRTEGDPAKLAGPVRAERPGPTKVPKKAPRRGRCSAGTCSASISESRTPESCRRCALHQRRVLRNSVIGGQALLRCLRASRCAACPVSQRREASSIRSATCR